MAEEGLFEKIEKIQMPIRIAILLGTIVLLTGAFIYFFYLPKTKEIEKTTRNIAKLRQDLKRAQIRAKDLKKLQAQKVQVDLQFKEALKLLPEQKEIPNLLKKITQLGNDSKLDFRLFVPQGERAQDLFVEIPVSIEVRGEYHNVAVFFDKVGHMARIMNIMNVSMKPTAGLSTDLITTCTAVTYMIKGEPDEKASKKKKKRRK